MPNRSWALCNLENCGAQQELLDWLTAELIQNFIGEGLSAYWTVGAAVGDVITATLQITENDGTTGIADTFSVWVWLSDTAAAAVTADAPDGGTAATTGTILQEHATDVSLDIKTHTDGSFSLAITESGVDTWYANVRLPNGRIVSSDAITFA